MKQLIYLFSFFLINCNHNNSNCIYTRDELLQSDKSKVFGTNITDGKITEFSDKGRDSIVGGYYSFYKNGNLKSYQFFANMKEYIYSEEYDENGNFNKVYGKPLVHNFAGLINDSQVYIKTFFFGLHKTYRNVNVSTSDKRHFDLALVNDSMYSNMKTASFGFYNLRTEQDISAYINVEYLNECTQKIERFKDTIQLHYAPISK